LNDEELEEEVGCNAIKDADDIVSDAAKAGTARDSDVLGDGANEEG
jgi:hypothetical protein